MAYNNDWSFDWDYDSNNEDVIEDNLDEDIFDEDNELDEDLPDDNNDLNEEFEEDIEEFKEKQDIEYDEKDVFLLWLFHELSTPNDEIEESRDLINGSQEPLLDLENEDQNVIRREKRILIEVPELERVRDDLKERGLSLNKIRNEIGMSFEHYYRSRTNSMSEECFKRLEVLLEREIPHNIELGAIKECKLKLNSQLAEFTTIILGDGGLYKRPKSKRDALAITINRVDAKPYLTHVKDLIYDIFQVYPSESPKENENATTLRLYGKPVVDAVESIGIIPGDKVENQISVPEWIKSNKEYLVSGLKGLFDTDGSLWVDSNNKSIFLSFRNASFPLAKDFKEMCETLNIKTQPKISNTEQINRETGKNYYGYQVIISSKHNVKKFLDSISPEKWEDHNRREYIGTKLILLNSEKLIQNEILRKIKEDYPNKSDRRYSIKYAMYLKKVCVDHGCEINEITIENAIKESLEYKNRRNSKRE